MAGGLGKFVKIAHCLRNLDISTFELCSCPVLRCLRMNQHSHKFIARCLMCSHDAFNFSHIIQPLQCIVISMYVRPPSAMLPSPKIHFKTHSTFSQFCRKLRPFQVSQTPNRSNIIFLSLHHHPHHDHADLQV